ncbi:elongation factor Ts [Streptococcus pneumoniae]|nr:elongation factor Ts [Streptococcus pneumoniae]
MHEKHQKSFHQYLLQQQRHLIHLYRKQLVSQLLDNTKVDQAYTLLAQVYIMDDSKTVEAYLESVNASVVEFARFEVGEGIEKAANDFEAEVAATMAAALNN